MIFYMSWVSCFQAHTYSQKIILSFIYSWLLALNLSLNLFKLLLNYRIDLFSTLFQYSSNYMNNMLYKIWYLPKISSSSSKYQNSTGALISFINSIPIMVKNNPAEQKK